MLLEIVESRATNTRIQRYSTSLPAPQTSNIRRRVEKYSFQHEFHFTGPSCRAKLKNCEFPTTRLLPCNPTPPSSTLFCSSRSVKNRPKPLPFPLWDRRLYRLTAGRRSVVAKFRVRLRLAVRRKLRPRRLKR